MTHTEILLTGIKFNCWFVDRFISDDYSAQPPAQKIEFDWIESFGIYRDFEIPNQALIGTSANRYRFVISRTFVA